ncbi:hypothetical protein AC622_18025 [Bacillus sp. FJAT-27916]|nr:hypothetical protein AC622_18025 [Bacillus sp. FJAT-27916]
MYFFENSFYLFILIVIMHLITLVNIVLFEGEWNGVAILLSNILFLIACVYFGIERRANKTK